MPDHERLGKLYTESQASFDLRLRPFHQHGGGDAGCRACRRADGGGFTAAEEALAYFHAALEERTVDWNIDLFEDCLANAYLELGRADEAIAEYERILRLNPNYPLAQYHLGQAYEQKGEAEKARVAYEQFLQIWKNADPDIAEVSAARKRLTGQS